MCLGITYIESAAVTMFGMQSSSRYEQCSGKLEPLGSPVLVIACFTGCGIIVYYAVYYYRAMH